jgi:hypothetical protein
MATSNVRTGGARGTHAGAPTDDPIPFMSSCPKCKHEQPQRGYPRVALLRFLEGHRDIEAYCVTCNHFWPISAEERQAIIESLGQ